MVERSSRGGAAVGLINHCAPLSTSEVGLNFARDAGSTGAFGPGWWHQTGLKGGGALVPVGATNRYQRPSLVPVGATNQDQRPCAGAVRWEV